MPNIQPTLHVLKLQNRLREIGINSITEHWDGHKHVDLFIPEAKIYIEVDGPNHLTNPNQILADFDREHYSDIDSFNTLRISNEILDKYFEKIAEAIAKVVIKRKQVL